MKVGDLVQEWLTEQIGIVIDTRLCGDGNARFPTKGSVQVLWTKQGLSMWNNYKEWKDVRSLEIVSESR